MAYLHVLSNIKTKHFTGHLPWRLEEQNYRFGSSVLILYLYLYNINQHKSPFISHAIRLQPFMCIYPMVHVIFNPHICTTTAPSYKTPVRVRKYPFYPTTNISNVSAALTNQTVKYKDSVRRRSLSAVVWLWFNVSSAVDHWINVVLKGLGHGATGGCLWRIITVSTHYGSISDLLGWHLQSTAVRHQQHLWLTVCFIHEKYVWNMVWWPIQARKYLKRFQTRIGSLFHQFFLF